MKSAAAREALAFLANNGITFQIAPKIIRVLLRGRVIYCFTNTTPPGAELPSNVSILYALYFDAKNGGDAQAVFKRYQIPLNALAAIFSH